MILSDLIGSHVVDEQGAPLGRVSDARFRLSGHTTPPRATLQGIIVSPRTAASFLGYERTGMTRPVVLARILRWLHRGSFFIAWSDIARIDEDTVTLRTGFEKGESALPR